MVSGLRHSDEAFAFARRRMLDRRSLSEASRASSFLETAARGQSVAR
jgi:hypothetical protein